MFGWFQKETKKQETKVGSPLTPGKYLNKKEYPLCSFDVNPDDLSRKVELILKTTNYDNILHAAIDNLTIKMGVAK